MSGVLARLPDVQVRKVTVAIVTFAQHGCDRRVMRRLERVRR
jgi:hypothetical protein